MNGLRQIYRLYANRTMLAVTALGFASGFPFLLVFSTLSLWLKDAGWTLTAIGAFSLVKIPYAFKWVWAPLLDRVHLPFLYRFGRRRSWAILMQICVFFSILGMACVDPAENPNLMWYSALAVCLSSASSDIVLDAYRVEKFQNRPEDQAGASAVFVLGYRLGLIFSGAGALCLADRTDWQNVYMIMACGAIVGFITLLCVNEPICESENVPTDDTLSERLKRFCRMSICDPLKNFISKKDWPWIVFLIFIYRMSDAYIAPMSFPFYDDMGFTKTEIAFVIKIYGMLSAIVGGLYGGILVKKNGLYGGLYICGWTQGLTTLIFSAQALVGHNVPFLTLTIVLENFSSGMATTALVGYISALCDRRYTATQYALLSSVMSLARDVFSATSGLLAERVSWPIFFVISALFSVLGIWTVVYLRTRDGKNLSMTANPD